MSRLYASIDSDSRKTQATSRGHKRIDAHVRGWSSGVRVVARIEDDQDVFDVYATAGSNGHTSDKLVATIRMRDEDGATAVSGVPGTTHSIPWIL